jgi:transcriptional regulator with XRE-family HTH domain
MDLATWMKRARMHKQLTQGQVGELLNVSKANVSHWESGRHEPSFGQVMRMAEHTGFSLAPLIPPRLFTSGLSPHAVRLGMTLDAVPRAQFLDAYWKAHRQIDEILMPLDPVPFYKPTEALLDTAETRHDRFREPASSAHRAGSTGPASETERSPSGPQSAAPVGSTTQTRARIGQAEPQSSRAGSRTKSKLADAAGAKRKRRT